MFVVIGKFSFIELSLNCAYTGSFNDILVIEAVRQIKHDFMALNQTLLE